MKRCAFSVLALLVLSFPGNAAAQVVINACGTVPKPGSYVLGKNLVATGDCLILAADFVTIDLNGFTLSGNGIGSAIRTNSASRTAITVKNGNIRNFLNGIDLAFDGTAVKVERVTVVGAGSGGTGVGANDSSTVRDSVVSNNGVGFAVGSRSVVTGNTATFNSDGFNVGSGSTLIGNTSGSNTRDGFQTQNGVTVVNNTAFANGRFGFLRGGGNFIGNTATLSGVADVDGGVNNSEHNVP